MVGYHLAELDQQTLDERYFCTHCDLVLCNALQTKCAHLYCADCLPKLYDNTIGSYVYSQDQVAFTDQETFADRLIQREITNLIVNCTYTEQGCSWKGELKSLDSHLCHCEWVKVECIHRECGQWVAKKTVWPNTWKKAASFV